MIEILIVLLLMGIVISLILPNFLKAIQHQKVLGVAQQTAILLRLARLEAIKTVTTTVVQIDTTKGTVTAFGDLNNNQTFDSNEKLVGKVDLSKGVTFMAVSGFSSPPSPAVAIFRTNGAVALAGAFRFQNANGDQLEARVLTATSGRVQIRKFQGGAWIAQGEGGQSWIWK
jgi:Tfp pilus assembly protein FimT